MRHDLWTPEQDDLLRRLWDTGMIAANIAERIGDKTKNAVVGRAHRLGLPARESPIGKGHYPTRGSVREMPSIVRKRTARMQAPARRPAPIVTRPGSECRWTDSSQAPWVFCGQSCQQGFDWCPEHKARVYVAKTQGPQDAKPGYVFQERSADSRISGGRRQSNAGKFR